MEENYPSLNELTFIVHLSFLQQDHCIN